MRLKSRRTPPDVGGTTTTPAHRPAPSPSARRPRSAKKPLRIRLLGTFGDRAFRVSVVSTAMSVPFQT